jgi:type II secretory pathway component GspD/PulD (secretin)
LNYRLYLLLLVAFSCWAGGDPVAAKLARSAKEARNSGRLVRAYMLFAEAAARDPQNPAYRANRDALAPIANLLSKAKVEEASDISGDIKAAEASPNEPDTEPVLEAASEREALSPALQPVPVVQASDGVRDFDLDADEKVVLSQVASAYGVRALWDRDLQAKSRIQFHLARADFHTAMEALTAATGTFVFPVNSHVIFFANDTESKRAEFEPTVALTVPLPNALGQRDLTEAANALRGVLGLRSVGYDSSSRVVVIQDRVSRARLARSLLEALLLPKSQVSIEVELMTFDTDRSYHYGVALPTSYRLVDFGRIGGFQSILSTAATAGTYLTFGGGSTLFGIGGISATLFATYTKSVASKLFDATVVASDGQEATLHVGDQYPIPQSIYGGFQQSGGSLYNPIGQVSYQDLGLVLKIKPHVSGSGDVSMEVEAQDDALGTETINTIPEVAERIFKGNITLREGEWAVVAGLDANTNTNTRSGVPGLAQIPGVDEVLAENNRDRRSSKLLLVIKPTITRLPMSDTISPQYLVGPRRGERVIL